MPAEHERESHSNHQTDQATASGSWRHLDSHRRRGTGTPERIDSVLVQLLARGPAPADADGPATSPPPVCAVCHDRGFVYRRTADGQPDYAQPVEMCGCRRQAWEASLPERIARYWDQHSGVPARFRGLRLEHHPNLLDLSNPGLLDRLLTADLRRSSWYFSGGYGRGKTGIAAGYAWRFLNEVGENVLFRKLPHLLAELRATYERPARRDEHDNGPTEAEVMRRYQTAGLLVLDDLGAEQLSGSGWVEDRLYQIIGERHDEALPTVFTSNLSLPELAQRIGERTVWRIAESCGKENVIELHGRNLRA